LGSLLLGLLLTSQFFRTALLGQLLGPLLLGQLLTSRFLGTALLSHLLRALLFGQLLTSQLLCAALLCQLLGALLLSQLLTSQLLRAALFSKLLGSLLLGLLLTSRFLDTAPLGQLLGPLLLSHLLLRQALLSRLLRLPLLGKPLPRKVFGPALFQFALRLFHSPLFCKFALALGLDASAQNFFFIGLLGQLRRWRGSVLGLLRRLRRGWRFRLGQDKAGLFAGLARDDFGFQRFLRRLRAWLGPRTRAPPQRPARRLGTWRRRQGRRRIAQGKAAAQRRRWLFDARHGRSLRRQGQRRHWRRHSSGRHSTGHRRHRRIGGRQGWQDRRGRRRRHRRKHNAQGTPRPWPHAWYAELKRQQQRMQQQGHQQAADQPAVGWRQRRGRARAGCRGRYEGVHAGTELG
jgi:hypothetical protein